MAKPECDRSFFPAMLDLGISQSGTSPVLELPAHRQSSYVNALPHVKPRTEAESIDVFKSALTRHQYHNGLAPVLRLNEYKNVDRRHPAEFYLGLAAVGSIVLNPTLFLKARQLRADVYIDEKHFLPASARMADGGEMDEDDARSLHFVASQRKPGSKDVIGTARLIVKRSKDDLLPVEKLFNIEPAAVGSVESSRYISRHEDKRVQAAASLALIRAMTLQAAEENASHLYAVLEKPLYRSFKMLGIPFEPISDLQFVEEYNTENFAVRCDPHSIIPSIRAQDAVRGKKPVAPFFEKVESSMGLGRFTKEF